MKNKDKLMRYEQLLCEIVLNVEAMRAGDHSFGPFQGCEDFRTSTAVIEWPKLEELIQKAKSELVDTMVTTKRK